MNTPPRVPKSLMFLALLLGLGLGQVASAAVTLSLTPAAVSNTYSGYITLRIGGLTNGETVLVQKYLDANANGIIDGPDTLVQQFPLTDGVQAVIGGVTNINVPSDLTPADGAITARLNFQNGDPAQNAVGKYAFRLSSPSGHFGPITNSFTVTNASYAQSFSGNVRSNGVAVPYAFVILFEPTPDGGQNPQAATVADGSGTFTLKAATGTYTLAAFKTGCVADLSQAANLVLASGGSIVTNLNLLAATESISGRVYDANNPSYGLPGLLVPAESTNNLLAVGFTDANGNYTVGVTPSSWKVQGDSGGLDFYGYLRPQNNPKVDSSTGSVASVNLVLPKATALFYGSIKDGLNHPLAGMRLFASDNTSSYSDDGVRTDVNGNYVAGALGGGTWNLQVSTGNPAYPNYLFSQPAFWQTGGTNLVLNQAVPQDFTALLGTNHITGWLWDSSSQGIPNIQVTANATIGGLVYQTQATTDANGDYTLYVVGGGWNVNVCCGCNNCGNGCLGTGYCCPNGQFVTVSGADMVADFTAPTSGQVAINTTSPLPDAQVGSFYSFPFSASTCQSSLSWSATNPPSGLSLGSDGTLSGTPDTAGSNFFYVQVSDGASTATQGFSLTVDASSSMLQITQEPANQTAQCGSGATFVVGAVGSGQLTYQWYLAATSNPLPGQTNASLGLSSLSLLNSGTGYYVTVTDNSGSTNSDVATLTVQDTVPPVITLNGSAAMNVECHGIFNDPGATANDSCAGAVSVTAYGAVNPNTTGTYTLSYVATDPSGNSATNTRVVHVVDTTPPIVTLNGNASMNVECHGSFSDPGATANDTCAGALAVTTLGSVNVNTTGDYLLKYVATDPSGNSATNTRTVHVVDTTPPVVTLNGNANMSVECHSGFTDPGATASDLCAGALPVTTHGTVNANTTGDYVLSYVATDPSGNSATNTRTVHVVDTTPPVVTSQPSSVTTNATATVNFTVGIIGGDLTYVWLKNGAPLNDGGKVSGSGTATLTLSNVLRADAANYSVIVSNILGATNSAAATLAVLDPVFVAQPTALSVLAGAPATFTATAAGTPTLQYQWYSIIGGHTNKLAGKTAASLSLGAASTAMAGSYFAVVTNQLSRPNSATSAVAKLTVYLPPTVTILTPRKGLVVNADQVELTGKAGDNVAVAGVWYQLNDGPWTQASGTTNWIAMVAGLAPNANVLRAYAMDTHGDVSATNSVSFTYIILAPLTVSIVGQGVVAPNENGKLLVVGKTYSVQEVPHGGFGAGGWSGSTNTSSPKLTFVMQSNLVFTAIFVDTRRPVLVITAPKVHQFLSNSLATVTGKAGDNVGVTAVYVQLNGGAWAPASSGDSYTNWTLAGLTLTQGANSVSAYAVDAAGNASLTNTISFTYSPGATLGPTSLAGMLGDVVEDGASPSQISFGVSEFARSSTDTNDTPGVGNYTYALVNSNTALFSTDYLLPPAKAGNGFLRLITFTNSNTATFTNDTGGNIAVTFSAAADLVPSPSTIITAQYDDGNGNTNTITFGEGVFTNTDSLGSASWGTCSFSRFSPVAAMLELDFTDPLDVGAVIYVQLEFATGNSGTQFSTFLDALGDPPQVEAGDFTITASSTPPAGHAPLSLSGFTAHVTPHGQSTFPVSFGLNTLSQTATSANDSSKVCDYTYMKTGPNTGQLVITSVAPPSGNTNGPSADVVNLTFSSTTSAVFTNANGQDFGTLTLSAATTLVPSSVAGKTFDATSASETDTVVLYSNGVFSHAGSNGTANSGTYTWAPYSPVAGMLVLQITAGNKDVGSIIYLQPTFSTTKSGVFTVTPFDSSGNQQTGNTGTFTFQ